MEKDIENRLLSQLIEKNKFDDRRDIQDLRALEANFRHRFEQRNQVTLTDKEFDRLRKEIVSSDVYAASQALRQKHTFHRDDGTTFDYTLMDTEKWCQNCFEVTHQIRMNTRYDGGHRYDVVLLLNGLPVAQIELKDTKINTRTAIQQIVDYKQDEGNGYLDTLFCFMQFFIVSNESETYYFANNNEEHFRFDAQESYLPIYTLAKKDNSPIENLYDFTDAFLNRCTLGETISRYIVLKHEGRKLVVMRPYQVYAVQEILHAVKDGDYNGYIWHTTGSGKTLTSFRAATLLKDVNEIEKCLFVVDRNDLDAQTRKEFNAYQPGCISDRIGSRLLSERLLSDDNEHKVLVTTIQKLGLILKRDRAEVHRHFANGRVVLIFDECHRSQFGDYHAMILEAFPRAQLFGFTGTPIFEKNSRQTRVDGTVRTRITTEKVFGRELHTYTITDAIEDRNVLRFLIEYFEPRGKVGADPGTPAFRAEVARTILEKHDKLTDDRLMNSLLAVSSIDEAIAYYDLFRELQEGPLCPAAGPLQIACIFSPATDTGATSAPGDDDEDEDLSQEKRDVKQHPAQKREALCRIIADYNQRYGTVCSIDEFDKYSEDLQLRIQDHKNRELPSNQKIDLTIVVDMLLTGFDSPYLNTLYVDKPLVHHRLIQAFSRTNRILHAAKPHGNILDFRGQKAAVDEAIQMFSGKSKEDAEKIWLADTIVTVIAETQDAIKRLDAFFVSEGLPCSADSVASLKGKSAKVRFVDHIQQVRRHIERLRQYQNRTPEQEALIQQLPLPEAEIRKFEQPYMKLYRQFHEGKSKNKPDHKEPTPDFQLYLFSRVLIDYDYIMRLISDFTQQPAGAKKALTLQQIQEIIESDAKFALDQEDLLAYVDSIQNSVLTEEQVKAGFRQFQKDKRYRALDKLAQSVGLEPVVLRELVDTAISKGAWDSLALSEVMKPIYPGWKERMEKEKALKEALRPVVDGLSGGREVRGL